MRASLVADEDHRARDAGMGEDRGVVSGPAGNRLVGQAELSCGITKPFDPGGIHGGRRGLQPAVQLELYAAFAADTGALRYEQVIERLERLLALAACLKTEF